MTPHVGWVGFEPTSRRTRRSRAARRRRALQSSFATNPQIVPPSGIEPEPLGLQPSAQTNYARAGYERRTRVGSARAAFTPNATRAFPARVQRSSYERHTQVGGRRGRRIIIVIIFGCQRATLAVRRAHLGRRRVRCQIARTYRDSRSGFQIAIRKVSCCVASVEWRPETPKGHLVFPGGPSSTQRVEARQVRGGPPQVPASPTKRRRLGSHDAAYAEIAGLAALATSHRICGRSFCT